MGALKQITIDPTPFDLETIEHIRGETAKRVDQFFSAKQLRTADAILWESGVELTLTPKD